MDFMKGYNQAYNVARNKFDESLPVGEIHMGDMFLRSKFREFFVEAIREVYGQEWQREQKKSEKRRKEKK